MERRSDGFLDKVKHIEKVSESIFVALKDGNEIKIPMSQIEGIWYGDGLSDVIKNKYLRHDEERKVLCPYCGTKMIQVGPCYSAEGTGWYQNRCSFHCPKCRTSSPTVTTSGSEEECIEMAYQAAIARAVI